MSIAKKILAALAAVLVLLSGVWCGIELYRYHAARSVWAGEIGIDWVYSQQAFDFVRYGVALEPDAAQGRYSFTETALPVPGFDGTAECFVRFNDFYSFDTIRSRGEVFARFDFSFLAPSGFSAARSDVRVNVTFYTDRTVLEVWCNAGAAPYFQKYLDQNGLRVQILTPDV